MSRHTSTLSNTLDTLSPVSSTSPQSNVRAVGSAFNPYYLSPPYNTRVRDLSNIRSDIASLIAADDSRDIRDKDMKLADAMETIQAQQIYIKELEEKINAVSPVEKELQKKIRSLEAELDHTRKKVHDLEYQTSMLKTRNDELQIRIDVERRQCDHKVMQKNLQVEKLQGHLQLLVDSENQLQSKCQQLDQTFNNYKRTMDNKVRALEKERISLQEQMGELRHKKSPMQPPPMHTNYPLVAELQKELEYYKGLSQQAHEIAVELEKSQYELKQAETKLQQLSQSELAKQLEEKDILLKALQAELTHCQEQERRFRDAQHEAKRLRDAVQNTELLQEEIHILKSKLERTDDVAAQCATLQVEIEALRGETHRWQEMFGNIEGYQSPSQLARALSDVQKERELLLSKKGELTAELHRLEAASTLDKKAMDEMKAELEVRSRKDQDQEELIRRLEKKVSILTKERDGIKRVLDAYNEDDALSSHNNQKIMRINELERALSEKDAFIQAMEHDMAKAAQSSSGALVVSLKEQIAKYKDEIGKLNREIEDVLEDNAMLQSRLGKGEYDPTKTKILHLAHNPHQQAIAAKNDVELEQLRTEAAMLRSLLQTQTQSTSLHQMQPQQSKTENEDEHENLKKKVLDAEKLNERLKGVFKQKIHDFREAVRILLGYHINVGNDQSLRVSSVYSEGGDNEYFIFRPEGGNMKLVDTEYSKKFDKEIQIYLTKCHSIPAFFSYLTMELFNKRTWNG